MERDRGLSLLRQAHIEGFLDCREARLFDRNWWLRVKWTLDWVERRNRNEVRRLRHELNCALLDYFTGDELVDLHWDQALTLEQSVAKVLLPWEKHKKKRLTRRQFHDLVEMWRAAWGSEKDPAVAEKIQRTAEHLRRMAAGVQGGRPWPTG